MHYKEVKGILSSKNGMNLFRGCTHGCIYCDSRSECYQMHHSFEDVEIKSNALTLLEEALRRKRNKCMIGMGSMCDPYMNLPVETDYTRESLALIEKYGFGITLITKSARVLNDLDLLVSINNKTKAVVQMTLTTYDEKLCKIVEPNVSTTKERFQALKILNKNKISTIVWLCPILPFINDTEENLQGILNYCIEAGVWGILCFNMGLTLREGNREYYYKMLDKHFPGIKEKYINTYGNAYSIPSPNNKRLMKIFNETCIKAGIRTDIDEIFSYLSAYETKTQGEQLSFF